MRTGVVLLELILALTVAALLALIVAPSVASIANAAALRTEVIRLAGELDAARSAAVRLDGRAELRLSDNTYSLAVLAGSDTVAKFSTRGPAASGVTLSGAGSTIAFGPEGIAMGASNRTLVLTRGGASRTVVISRLGRLTY